MTIGIETLREYARRAGRHPRTVAGGLPSGAIAGMVSREVWDALSERDQLVLLVVDDCESGRYGVAELRRRLYATALCVCGHTRGAHGMPGLDETFVPVEDPNGSMYESPPCMATVAGDRCPCVQFEAVGPTRVP